MKKVIALCSILMLCILTSAIAQPPGGGDPATMKARMKERIKPQLIEQTKITETEADKVIDIYFDAQQEMRKLRQDEAMSEDDKKAKTKEIMDGRDKKLKEIPLTDDKVKAVNSFYEEMRKRMMERGGGQGAGRANQ